VEEVSLSYHAPRKRWKLPKVTVGLKWLTPALIIKAVLASFPRAQGGSLREKHRYSE
jgi:hypothetical protein